MNVERLTDETQLDALAASWDALSRGVPFRSSSWLAPWWRHYRRRGRQLYMLLVRDSDDRLVGLAPWYLEPSRTQGRVLRWLGSGEVCTDHLSVLCRPEQEEEVTSVVADWLLAAASSAPGTGEDRWDLLRLESVSQGDTAVARLVSRLAEAGCSIHRRRSEDTWQIDLPDSWEGYLAGLSKSHRKQLRRLHKRLVNSGRARLLRAEDTERLKKGMALLVDLHQQRWQALGEAGCFASPSFSDFLHEAAGVLFHRGQLQLHWLEVDDQPAAVEIRLASNGLVYAYQSGIDPGRLEDEPGRLITMVGLQQAIAQNCRGFDLLRGNEPYKAHWRALPRAAWNVRVVPRRTTPQLRHHAWLAGDTMKQWIKQGLSLAGMQ